MKKKPLEEKGVLKPKELMADFKAMPFLIKLLLIISLYSLVTTIQNLVQMKPIDFDYFNSGFPRNYPLVWYLYYLLLDVFTIVIFFKRSYSVLKKYVCFSIAILLIAFFNSIYSTANVLSEQRAVTTIIFGLTYAIVVLINLYLLKQKKYFNKI